MHESRHIQYSFRFSTERGRETIIVSCKMSTIFFFFFSIPVHRQINNWI